MKSIIIFLLILSCFFQCQNQKMNDSSSDGLTLELIPPHSPKSPFFNHYHHISLHLDTITPSVKRYQRNSVVEVGLGTFIGASPSYKSYFLLVDTGSSLTWLQCEGCKPSNCYFQKEEPFPNSQSKSFRPLLCDGKNPFCEKGQCSGRQCTYSLDYLDSGSSSGILAKESFSFPPNPSSPSTSNMVVKDMVFGCGTNNKEKAAYQTANYEVAGIFGLGQGSQSFQKQNQQLTGGKFSYCFVGDGDAQPTYLRFGSHIKPPPNMKTIQFFQRGPLEDAYYVKLRDLGVAGKPLHIDPKVIDPPGSKDKGGCIVDSGFSDSTLITGAYDIVVKRLTQHFSKHPGFKKDRSCGENELCYCRRSIQGYKDIPSFTFYFEGAQLDVRPEGTFERTLKYDGRECFQLRISNHSTITGVGHFQQVNIKFIYDIMSNKIHFGSEDCAKNN